MNKENKYIKEFEKIVGIEDSELMKDYPYTIRKLKELTLKALKSQRKEIIEKIEKKILSKNLDRNCKFCGMNKSYCIEHDCGKEEVYNQTLDEIITLIKEDE